MKGIARLLAPAALAAAGCVSSSDIQKLQAQIADVNREVLQLQMQGSSKQEIASLEATIKQQSQDLLKVEADLRIDVQNLSAQLDELRGKLDDTNYRLQQVSQQIAATNQDVKAVRDATNPTVPAPGTAVPGSPGAAGSAGDPETLYQNAYSDYLKGNYDLALMGFHQYVEAFPETDLADNATYWIGECHYRQKQYRQAIEEYDKVLSAYPRSDKTASARLKKGFALIELGDRKGAIAELEEVVRSFASSDEANLARQRLHDLGVDPAKRHG